MDRLTAIARAQGRLSVTGAPEGYDSYVAAEAAKRSNSLVVFVAADDAHAAIALESARFFAPATPTRARARCANRASSRGAAESSISGHPAAPSRFASISSAPRSRPF